MKNNFLQLNVYYEAIESVQYNEISIYDNYQFVSDLGKLYCYFRHLDMTIVIE